MEKEIAKLLLQIKAIKLEPTNYFTWASGWKSPIYCDNRKTLSYPDARKLIKNAFVDLIKENYRMPDVIAGVATGAIAIGALVAEELNIPFVYVRDSVKKHGMGNVIEGEFKKGQSVVVIEDLISTGMSSLRAVKALREADAEI
ncbi:MAG: orotate phosphoribosyltransferase, partial [Bacteroidota bacterium]|nr:orotate phosphoribosyltransferase [Bacteroidota bacterium]